MWLTDKCCFCVDLKSASLLLASLGTFSHLYNAVLLFTMPRAHHGPDPRDDFEPLYETPYKLMALYYLGASIICLMAVRGVIRSDHRQLRLFALLTWFEFGCSVALTAIFALMAFSIDVDSACRGLTDRPDVDMDVKECTSMYVSMASWASMFMTVGLFIKLHYCLVVQSYYVRLLGEAQFIELVHDAPYGYTVITSAAPPPDYSESTMSANIVPDSKKCPDGRPFNC